MTDIATLGFRVDSRQIVTAKKDLDQLSDSAKKTSQAQKDLGNSSVKAGQDIEKQQKMIAGLSLVMGGLGGIIRNLVVAYAGLSIIKQTFENTINQERVFSQLNATLRATGQYTDELSRTMREFGSEIQNVSTFGDDLVVKAQSLLLTFGNISGETFPRTIKAATDLATALGTDLNSAVSQIGKALASPVQGLTLLRRAGVIFSKDQAELIKSLAETNRLAEAQDLILKELEARYGGSALAARQTLGGAIDALKNSFGDLLEGENGLVGARNAIEELVTLLDSPHVKRGFDAFVTGLTMILTVSVKVVSTMANLLVQLGELPAKIQYGFSTFTRESIDKELAEVEAKLEKALRRATQHSDRYISSLRAQREKLLEQRAFFENIIPESVPTAYEKLAQMVRGTDDAYDELNETLKTTTNVVDEQIKVLQFQASTLGLTTREITLYDLSLKGATTSQLALANASLLVIENFQKMEELNRTRTRIDPFFNETSSFETQIDNIQKLFDAKMLSEQNYRVLTLIAEQEHSQKLIQLAEQRFSKQSELNKLLIDSLNSFQTTGTQVFTSLLVGTTNLRDAVRNLAGSILQNAVGALVQLGVQAVKNKILADTIQSATTVSAVATGSAIASAYAPAAAMVSLATLGSNSAPAQASLVSTTALAKSLAIPSFEGGGFTGRGGRSGGMDGRGGFLSMLHPNETVIDNTKGSLQSDENVPQTDPNITVNVINAPQGTQVAYNTRQDGQKVIDILISDLALGGDISRSFENFYGITRKGI